MKNIVLTLSLMMVGLMSFGQTGIGTPNPDPSAQLDVYSTDKGMLIPRVELNQTTDNAPIGNDIADGLMVFNTADQNDVTPGFYYWYNNKWQRLIPDGAATMSKVFYMPAVLFDTSTLGADQTKNLHDEYMSQFTGTDLIGSDQAPSAIPNIPDPEDLYYYITSYDKDVIDNVSIDADGTMHYDVIGHAGQYSFVNIVFVVKD